MRHLDFSVARTVSDMLAPHENSILQQVPVILHSDEGEVRIRARDSTPFQTSMF
jgi:hypothetical protein